MRLVQVYKNKGREERPQALQTKPLEASRILFVTALFIYLLPHIVYPKALEYRVLVFRRIERLAVKGENSEMS